jgi:hypothetical protein
VGIAIARVLSLFASFMSLQTVARLIEWRLATVVRDSPDRRSCTQLSDGEFLQFDISTLTW